MTGGLTGPTAVQAQSSPEPAAEDADAIGEPLRLGPADGPGPPNVSDPSALDSSSGDPSGGDPSGGDRPGGQPAGLSDPASSASDPTARGDSDGIQVDRLEEMSLETLGVLEGADGALGADMWSRTPRRRVEALLPRLPGALDAPVLRDLARRLLLSPAAAPERRHAEGARRNLLALRVDRLAAIGAADGLIRLIDALPRSARSPAVRRHHVEALLLTHRRAAACTAVRKAVRDSDSAFWQRALALCQFADGALAQSDLTVRLLRERMDGDHAGFPALYEAATTDRQSLPESLPEALGPLHLGLIAVSGLPLPDSSLSGLPAGTLTAVATAETGALAVRARAAERGAALGALPVRQLGALYDRFAFAEDDLIGAASQAAERQRDKLTPVRRRALLYQAVQREPAPAVRAELLRQLLTDRTPGGFIAAARLLADALTALPAEPELAWFAATAGRALYAADRPEAAGRWLRMVQQEAILNPEAAAAVTALWPYAKLAGAAELPANGGLAAWRRAQDGAGGTSTTSRESLLRALLGALGRAPERSWVDIALDAPGSPRPAPPAALMYALQEAGEADRLGETVLLTLLVIGQQGLEECHPAALGIAVTALKRVGLAATAHRLALQAAIYRGI